MIFTVDDTKFVRGSLVSVNLKNGCFFAWSRGGGSSELASRSRARRSRANCLAQPRDRQRQESIPADPGAHAAVNIDYLDASEHIGKRY